MNSEWINRLQLELKKPLPGLEAQLRLSPKGRGISPAESHARKSAVLILLHGEGEKIYTVLIKRTEYKGVHSGQISYPGGMYKRTDGTLEKTALRETREETGLEITNMHILGKLTTLYIPVSQTIVYPFVGIYTGNLIFNPDPYEVNYIITADLEEFKDQRNHKSKTMMIGGTAIEIPYFDIRDEHIWGATAMITSEFLEIIQRTAV